MSVSQGIWSSWKPVNEENSHGLDMVDIKTQVETMIGKTEVFKDFEFKEYKVFSKDQTSDVTSIQLLVQVKKGSYKAYGSFVLVEIELIENTHKVVRVSNKRHPGLMNKLVVLEGDKKGEHLTLGDDYPFENFLTPATKYIQNILDSLFINPKEGPWDKLLPESFRPFVSVPLPKVIALAFVCRLEEPGRMYTVLAKMTYDEFDNVPKQRKMEDQFRLLTILSKNKKYTLEDSKSVPRDDYLPGLVGGFTDWQAMNKEVEKIALLVKDKVCAGLQDCNAYDPRRYRVQASTREPTYQIEIKVKKNIVLGSREVFAPRGVVFVDVQLSGENYQIRNLRIVPSISSELIYLPTDWSLLFEGNDMGDKGGENIHQLVAKFYPDMVFHVLYWKYKCDSIGYLFKVLVKVGQDDKAKFELIEIRSYPPFPSNENVELVDRIPVDYF